MFFSNLSFGTEEIIESQKSSLKINDFIENSKEYTKDVFKDIDFNEFFNSMLKGQVDNKFIFKGIISVFKNELKQNTSLMIKILIVVIIHSIIKSITENLGTDSTSKISYFLQYILISTFIIESFSSIINLTKTTIEDLVFFMKLLIPLLVTLMLTTGQFAFANIVEPVLLFMMNFIGEFIVVFVIPLVMVCMVLAIASNFSKEISINKLSKFIKKAILWMLGIVLTIFVTTLSLEGTLGSSVDNLTSKTAKAVVSDFIPVVGKILGDSAETIIGCSKVLKTSVGLFGVVVLISIVAIPVIKIGILWISFKLTACLCDVIADEKIVKLIDEISDCYKILLGVLSAVSVMLIVGITIVIKATS